MWTYSVDGAEHVLLCRDGQYAGTRCAWSINETEGTICLFGDRSHGYGVWDGRVVHWHSPVGYRCFAYPVQEGGSFARDATRDRHGFPTAWHREDNGSGYKLVATDNHSPSLITNAVVTGSVPMVVAVLIAMFAASMTVIEEQREAIRRREAAEAARRERLMATTGSGGGSRVPPPGRLYGKIQIVTSFPDVTVQVVSSFSDINVQVVNSFPDRPGKWQIVDSFPDYKVQIVSSFADYKIKYVTSFPGVN